jgi:hypothetical protein
MRGAVVTLLVPREGASLLHLLEHLHARLGGTRHLRRCCRRLGHLTPELGHLTPGTGEARQFAAHSISGRLWLVPIWRLLLLLQAYTVIA